MGMGRAVTALALWFLVITALSVAGGCQSQPLDGPRITIADGELQGAASGDVHVFKGIPYAAPPLGELRWQPPRPAPRWPGTRRADEFGAACPQPQRRDRATGVGATSEDCLYLNIWAPANAVEAPVMVWIHGGAFRIGSGSLPFYDGTSFAENGVILVTLNYRLGRLGFFAHPALAQGGNFGLMDQVAALQWVQRNIGAFGGAADNVTVFGESAGAVSVLHLLTSPKTEGLFARAAIQSGGGQQVIGHLTEQRGGRPSLLAAGLSWRDASVSAVRLRALPVEEVVDAGQIEGIGSVGPVIDGEWVVDDPATRLAQGAFHKVPVLVGSNSHEASVLAAFGTDAETVVAASGADVAALRRLYPGDDWASRAWGDAAFVAGARMTARRVAQADGEAYLYHFDYVLQRRRGKVPGAGHGSEIPFVFNTLDRLPMARLLVTDADRGMARRLHSHWLSFARGGNPAGQVRGYWPAYTVKNDTLLYIGDTVEPRAGFRWEQLNFHDQRGARRGGR